MEQGQDEKSTRTMKRRRSRVVRRRSGLKYFLLPCSYCLIRSGYVCINIFYFQSVSDLSIVVVDAFILSSKTHARDSTRKNKKCRGSTCRNTDPQPRSSLSSSLNNNNNIEWSPSLENTLFGNEKRSVEMWTSLSNNKSGKRINFEENSSFAVRMASFEDSEIASVEETEVPSDENIEEVFEQSDEQTLQRRKFLHSLIAATTASTAVEPSSAYQTTFPEDLEFSNDKYVDDNTNPSIIFEALTEDRLAVQKSRSKNAQQPRRPQNNLSPSVFDQVGPLGAVAWGGALWLLLGSRSNPLVKPLANVIYNVDSKKGAWVKGRNEGLFTPIPPAFTILMGVVFIGLGLVTNVFVLFATQGNMELAFQLAGVSLITGGTLELGRIASGEKMSTKEEMARDKMLVEEFEEFAERRLVVVKSGSVHRSEVTKSFRKYFAKYRVENDEYPLVDLEVERLLRRWNASKGSREEISSAGFLKGVKINTDAEIQ